MKKIIILAAIIAAPMANCAPIVTNLGVAMQGLSVVGAVSDGDYIYGITRSSGKATIFKVSKATGKAVAQTKLPKVLGGWKVLDGSGMFYAITYKPAAIYSVDKKSLQFKKLADFGMGYAWDAVQTGRDIIVTTSNIGKAYTYNKATGRVTFKKITAQSTIRTAATIGGKVFYGTGMKAELWLNGRNILPAKYNNQELVYSMAVSGSKVIAGLTPSHTMISYDVKSNKFAESSKSIISDPLSKPDLRLPVLDCIGYPCQYDAKTGQLLKLSSQALAGASIINGRLVGITRDGHYYNNGKLTESGIKKEAVVPFSMAANNGVVSLSWQNMRVITKTKDIYLSPGSEGKASCMSGGQLYTGNYTRAALYKYSPNNPVKLAPLALIKNGQNRPTGIDCNNDLLVVSTEPNYGKFGGAVTTYGTKTGNISVIKSIFHGQTAASVALIPGGSLVIGTSIYGGSGAVGTAGKSAYVIRYNHGVVFRAAIPAPIVKNVFYVDGFIIALGSNGVIYKLNNKGSIIGQKAIDVKIIVKSNDNRVFGIDKGGVVAININSLSKSTIAKTHDPKLMAIDKTNNDIYVVSSVNLLKIRGY